VSKVIAPQQFMDDNGSLTYAKAEGVYLVGAEAPTFADRVVSARAARQPDTAVILTFGQSNAANMGEGHYVADGPVHVFNIFDRRYYRAIDPLPGASNDGGSVWGRLGDRLIASGQFRSILLIPLASGGSYIVDWAPGGVYHRRLPFAIKRISAAGLVPDILCWHQGEAEANLTMMSAAEYRRHFLSMLNSIRETGIDAPIYVATATLCANEEHPFDNRDAIRAAQKELIAAAGDILPGPDTDLIGVEHRWDRCHFSATGLELAAKAWLEAFIEHPVKPRQLSHDPAWASQTLSRLRITTSKRGIKSLVKQTKYAVKQFILRGLERRGYLLIKKSGKRDGY
jgi:Carbohydrate esterase, sialic acid-specific acetylesterase